MIQALGGAMDGYRKGVAMIEQAVRGLATPRGTASGWSSAPVEQEAGPPGEVPGDLADAVVALASGRIQARAGVRVMGVTLEAVDALIDILA